MYYYYFLQFIGDIHQKRGAKKKKKKKKKTTVQMCRQRGARLYPAAKQCAPENNLSGKKRKGKKRLSVRCVSHVK